MPATTAPMLYGRLLFGLVLLRRIMYRRLRRRCNRLGCVLDWRFWRRRYRFGYVLDWWFRRRWCRLGCILHRWFRLGLGRLFFFGFLGFRFLNNLIARIKSLNVVAFPAIIYIVEGIDYFMQSCKSITDCLRFT